MGQCIKRKKSNKRKKLRKRIRVQDEPKENVPVQNVNKNGSSSSNRKLLIPRRVKEEPRQAKILTHNKLFALQKKLEILNKKKKELAKEPDVKKGTLLVKQEESILKE